MTQEEKPCPWRRFVGRMFDYCVFGLLLGWLLAILGLSIDDNPYGILLIPFLWIFVETILLSTWGSTPGKWMTQTTITRSDNKPLTFRDALYRSLSVWWLGLGAGLPIVSFITMIVASVKLSNLGKTSWDRSGDFVIRHGKIGAFRTIALIVFFLALFWGVFPLVLNGN